MDARRRHGVGGPEPRPRWRIDDVLARTDLANLLDHLTQAATYTTRGRRWHCPVPNHDDRRASVTMHTDSRGHERWRCWSGDDTHRGDALDLVMLTQGGSRADAVEWLANRAGMVPNQPLPPVTRARPPARAQFVPLDPAVARYVEACERILWSRAGQPVRAWLASRGLDKDVIRANRVGADPGRRMLRRSRGLPYGSSVAATFPALDQTGNVRYVQTRYLQPGERDKYDNPAAALGTNPRLSWCRPVGDSRSGVLVVCEGIPDALTAAQAGFTAAAVLGSHAPDQSVAARLANRSDRDNLNIVIVVDHDDAGRRWGQRLGDVLADHDHHPDIVVPPTQGQDLNDWARQDPTWIQSMTADLPTAQRSSPGQAIDPVGPSGIDLSGDDNGVIV